MSDAFSTLVAIQPTVAELTSEGKEGIREAKTSPTSGPIWNALRARDMSSGRGVPTGGGLANALPAALSLSATPNNDKIQLTWTAVSGAVSYAVFWTTDVSQRVGLWNRINLGNVTSYLTGSLSVTMYFFTVAAVNSDGVDGQFADVVKATPSAPSISPPDGLSLVAQDIQSVTAVWSTVPGAASYAIYCSGSPGQGKSGTRYTSVGTFLTLSGLNTSLNLYVSAASVDAQGEGPLGVEKSIAILFSPISTSNTSSLANASFQLTATGGTGSGYVWTMVTNNSGGSITSGGMYTAGSSAGVDTVRVTDPLGHTTTANVTVTLTISTMIPQRTSLTHITVSGGNLLDIASAGWVKQGNPPAIAGATVLGRSSVEAIGPFTDTDYYKLGTVSDSGTGLLDFTTGDFTICVVGRGNPTEAALISNGNYGGRGWYLQLAVNPGNNTDPPNVVRFWASGTAGGNAGSTALGSALGCFDVAFTPDASTPWVITVSRSGGTLRMKVNQLAISSAAIANIGADTTYTAMLGRYASTGLAFGQNSYQTGGSANARIHEAQITNTGFSTDAALNAFQAQVLDALVDANTTALWRFDNNANDAGYLGLTLTRTGTTYVNDHLGAATKALDGAGSGNYAYVNDTGSNDLKTVCGGDFTIEGWVKPASSPNGLGMFFTLGTAGSAGTSNRWVWLMHDGAANYNADKPLVALTYDGADTQLIPSLGAGGGLVPGSWSHFAFRRKSVGGGKFQMDLIVNNVQVATGNNFNPLTLTGSGRVELFVATDSASFPFKGTLDNIRISNKYRSNAEIAAYYAAS